MDIPPWSSPPLPPRRCLCRATSHSIIAPWAYYAVWRQKSRDGKLRFFLHCASPAEDSVSWSAPPRRGRQRDAGTAGPDEEEGVEQETEDRSQNKTGV